MRDRDGGHHSQPGGGDSKRAALRVAPGPVHLTEATQAQSPFLLLGDHAGTLVPPDLQALGLAAADLARHIAVDIGVAALGVALAERTGAAFLAQRYSRLVVDCNRDPASAEAIPEVSDGTAIPGNRALSEGARAERIAAIHQPYHAAIAGRLDARAAAASRTVVIALHSFTPMLLTTARDDGPRPWTIGVLHARQPGSYAARVLEALRGEPGETIGDNEPYLFDTIDYTVPRHAQARALEWVELEVRQDLLLTPEGIARKADLIARVLTAAL